MFPGMMLAMSCVAVALRSRPQYNKKYNREPSQFDGYTTDDVFRVLGKHPTLPTVLRYAAPVQMRFDAVTGTPYLPNAADANSMVVNPLELSFESKEPGGVSNSSDASGGGGGGSAAGSTSNITGSGAAAAVSATAAQQLPASTSPVKRTPIFKHRNNQHIDTRSPSVLRQLRKAAG